MNQLKAICKLHWMDTRFSYAIFWGILLLVTALAFVITFYFSGGNIYFGGNISIYIYLMIHAMISFKETFPYALGLGSTRKRYALGSFVFFIIFAGITALLQNAYIALSNTLTNLLEIKQGVVFQLGLISGMEYSFLTVLWFDFVLALFLLGFFHFFATIHFRYGYLPLLIILGIYFLTLFAPIGREMWIFLYQSFATTEWVFVLSIVLPLASLCFFFFGWLVLRKSPSRPLKA